MMLVALLKKILRQYNRYPHISSNQLINIVLHVVNKYICIKLDETDDGFLAASYVMEIRKSINKIENDF